MPLLCSDLPAMRELLGGFGEAVRFVEPMGSEISDKVRDFAESPWSAEVRQYEDVYGKLL